MSNFLVVKGFTKRLEYRWEYFCKFIKYSKFVNLRVPIMIKYAIKGSDPKLTVYKTGDQIYNSVVKDLMGKFEPLNGDYILPTDYLKVLAINYKTLTDMIQIPVIKVIRQDMSTECIRMVNFYLRELRRI